MGCGGSKIDDQQLVILCRERKELLKTASHHRSALAVAHLVYLQSLRDVGEAIQRFVDEEESVSSPVLTLPSDEGKPTKQRRGSISSTSISHSVIEEEGEEEDGTGSHLNLSSIGSESGLEDGSDDDDDDGGHIQIDTTPEPELNRSKQTFSPGNRSKQTFSPGYGYPPPGYPYPYPVGGWGFNGDPNRGMYFMKKSAAQSQPFVFKPENHRVEPSDYGNSGYFINPGSTGSSYLPNANYSGYPPPSPAKPPPPTLPSPPRVSTWDFLNVFDTYDYGNSRSRAPSYYYPPGTASISSSPDSKEVREKEGIPELEEVPEHEVIKQVYRRPKRTPALEKVKERKETLKTVPLPEEAATEESSLDTETVSTFSGSDVEEESDFHYVKSSNSSSGQETIMETEGSEQQVNGSKKGVVSIELDEEGASSSTSSFDVESSKISSFSSLSVRATREIKEVVEEIKSEFEIAASCGKEVAVLLEVSKLPYQHKDKSGFKVILSRIMYLVAPSKRSKPELSIRLTSKTLQLAKAYNGQDVNVGSTGNLSSTLDKLYAWEKKLYKEVKGEEKLRSIYEEKCRSLKKMDAHGAEATKIEATRAYIRKLLMKIDISIRSVDSISRRIHKLRDEELQPQLTQLIHGLVRMWRSMLKCHQKQFQAIMETKVQSVKANTVSSSKAFLDLEMELRDWCSSFNEWVNTQKKYVHSLNRWLSKCLHYEPEVTEDGYAPFSPSQIGAPPIFTVCKDWEEAMGRVSGEKVSNAMQGFASSLHEMWERQEEEEQRLRAEQNQDHAESDDKRSVVSKGRSESGVSVLDDLRVDLDSMRKKLVEERGKRRETTTVKAVASSSSTLKGGLAPVFDALRKFNVEVVKAHGIVRLQHPRTSS
ncbi:protein ROLLING AND ERECT LEAF 2-like isoform X1 [Raphanus sativus]|uniref:Protein ROLLING AND ERECT LEAF 2-like isoform X1 n=1 Tax=Raphanus sativus TaxID=3726 RepID=A0A9W3CG07_RAPSA|nr:protein ROLLING AND ERECT LEAF 2-like isoform X1 [Raphanus sativus]